MERAYIDAYSQNCRLIRFDQRGSGLSEPALPRIDLDQLADDIGSVADALGLDKFILMGTSRESHQAIYFAAKYPKRVSKLIIQNGYVDGRVLRNGTAELDTEDALLALMREGWDNSTSTFVAAAISVISPVQRTKHFARSQIFFRCHAQTRLHCCSGSSSMGTRLRLILPTYARRR